MNQWNDEAGLPRPSPEGEEQRLFETFGDVLIRAIGRMGVPKNEAHALVHEAFVVYGGLDPRPQDARAWLIAAAGTQATTYLQKRGLPIGGDVAKETRAVEHLDFRREMLAALPRRARQAVRLRFAEGKSYPEIAAELGVTEHAAVRIVARARAKLAAMGWKGGGT
jgi:RNA polymerase sigma factor (sigma-70 family)